MKESEIKERAEVFNMNKALDSWRALRSLGLLTTEEQKNISDKINKKYSIK